MTREEGSPIEDSHEPGLRLEPFTPEALERLESRRRNAARDLKRPLKKSSLRECEVLSLPPHPQSLYGKPVTELEHLILDKTFCVVTKRFSKYYLYRFAATNSLFLFTPWSCVRSLAIRLSTHRYFDYFVIITIIVNCVFIALSSAPEETEYIFLSIYTVEMAIKCVAKGFILDRFTYLRNPWNWIDFIVITCGYLTFCLPADGIDVGSLTGLRTFRVLRALKTVSILPGLKTIVNAMLHSIKMLAEVMALAAFCLMVFALLALQLYMGLLRQGCVQNLISNKTSNVATETTLQLCGNVSGARSCPSGFTCMPNVSPNPNFGYTNFDSYGWAILNCLQLITLDYWEDIYNKVMEVSGPGSIFFFLMVVFFGSFYLVNLTLAVVAICYEEEAATALREKDKGGNAHKMPKVTRILTRFMNKKPERCISHEGKQSTEVISLQSYNNEDAVRPALLMQSVAPDLVISAGEQLPSSSNSYVRRSSIHLNRQSNRYKRSGIHDDETSDTDSTIIQLPHAPTRDIPTCWEESISSEDTHESPKKPGLKIRLLTCIHAGRNVCSWTQRLLHVIVSDPLFDLFITLCILLNTALLSLEHHQMSSDLQQVLEMGNLIFTTIFSLEAFLKILALGKRYFRSKWNIFDLIVVFLSLMDLIFETAGGLSVLRTFRLLRVLKLAQAWPTMRMLLTIIGTTLGAVGNLTIVLGVIMYIFAVLGMQLFSDIYTAERFSPLPVPRWNFSDFFHSFLLVFRVLCGEWVQPLWDCLNAAKEKNHLCFLLFLTALTVGNFLVLNLFLAMLLNSFNTKELKQREEKDVDSTALAGFRRLKSVLSRRQTMVEEHLEEEMEKPPPVQPKIAWEKKRFPRLTLGKIRILRETCEKEDRRIDYVDKEIIEILNIDEEPSITKIKNFQNGDNENNEKIIKLDDRKHEIKDCFPKLCYKWFPNVCNSKASSYVVRIRNVSLIVVEHPIFEWFILILIFSSSFLLCFEDIYLPEKPFLQQILGWLNTVFTGLFVIEMLIKWVAFGLVAYFTNFWTFMDCIIVNVSLLSIVLENTGSSLYALRAIRTLRALRPLRAVSRWQGMKIVVNALVSAIPSIINVLLVCILFWLIFSIMGVQFFSGRFFKCVDADGVRLSADTANNKSQCLETNYTWQNAKINFDNVGNAYLALLQVATFEGWLEIMADATDSRQVDDQPIREANMAASLYFVVFIICGSFITLNLFIGVIIDNFNMLKQKYEGGILQMFLTESQKTYYTAMQKLGRKKPQRVIPRPKNRYQSWFYDVAISGKFELLVFILILLNMVVMSCEHYQQPVQMTVVLGSLNIAFTACFCVEAIVKMIGLRHHYFTLPWNVFDLIVVISSLLGIVFEEVLQTFVISPTLLRVTRLVRIGRVLRLIKAAKGIRKLLFALIISLPALFNIGALLFLVMFIYAIIGMSLFGQVLKLGALNSMVNFETFANSMVLLFRVSTSAGWNDVLEPLLVQPPDCDPHHKNLPNGNCGHPLVAIIFFVSYIIINFMVIINMYIAVIIENLNQASREEEMGISEEDIEMFYICWSQYDPHATQFINFSELSEFVAVLDPPLRIPQPNALAIVAMDIPISKGDKIHCLDILHALTKVVLGDIEETEEFLKLQKQMDERFQKSFPTRNQAEIVSTTFDWKQKDNAARTIQKAFRKMKSKNKN